MSCLGAHMSAAGGLHKAFEIAERAGCDCLQIFVKNQLRWRAAPLSAEALRVWREAFAATRVRPVVAHATYLINLASPNPALWDRSLRAFALELRRCGDLGVAGLVVHPGSHMGAGEGPGCARVARALRRVLSATPGVRTRILLEITAGQGNTLGWRFEHLRDILGAVDGDPRVGICFDTCHAVAAGHRLDTDEGYAATMGAVRRCVGLGRIRCFHLNDSKGPLGSRIDRHTHIGAGHVGLSGFRRIVNDPRFARVPMILETPKGVDARGRDLDRVNLSRLRRLARSGP